MEKGFLVTRTFKVLNSNFGNFSYTTSVFRDRNEAIKVLTFPSKYYSVRRIGKNDWVQFPVDDKVGSVTEISLTEVNIF